ncbi:hypothetical protein GCM10010275_14020 [Streptomyces litmocidini]|nr:hypothetical protein GCM10010275_14020 [Streptomyces litmocidini]
MPDELWERIAPLLPPRLYEVLLTGLRKAGLLDMDDATIDGSHVRALKRGLTPDLRRWTVAGRAASTT